MQEVVTEAEVHFTISITIKSAVNTRYTPGIRNY